MAEDGNDKRGADISLNSIIRVQVDVVPAGWQYTVDRAVGSGGGSCSLGTIDKEQLMEAP